MLKKISITATFAVFIGAGMIFLHSCKKEEIKTPTITIDLTGSTTNDFGAVQTGSVSAPMSYKVTGKDLQGDVTVKAPDFFQVSKDGGSTFSSQITLTISEVQGSGGKLIGIRFAPTSGVPGLKKGTVVHSSENAKDVSYEWSGTEE